MDPKLDYIDINAISMRISSMYTATSTPKLQKTFDVFFRNQKSKCVEFLEWDSESPDIFVSELNCFALFLRNF